MSKKGKTTKPAKPAKTATKKTASANTEMLLVGSKVKAALKANGCNVSSDALEGLNAWVYWLVDQASRRAAANGRKTVRSHDFMNV